MLRRAVQLQPYDWELVLAPVFKCYRSTVFEATGVTPFRLAFGRKMRSYGVCLGGFGAVSRDL